MKLVCTTVRIDQVGRVLDMLRTLGYTHVGVGEADAPDAVRLEVHVKQVDARSAAVALARATSQDPQPVHVIEAAPLAAAQSAGG